MNNSEKLILTRGDWIRVIASLDTEATALENNDGVWNKDDATRVRGLANNLYRQLHDGHYKNSLVQQSERAKTNAAENELPF